MKTLKGVWLIIIATLIYLGLVMVLSTITVNGIIVLFAPTVITPILMIPMFL